MWGPLSEYLDAVSGLAASVPVVDASAVPAEDFGKNDVQELRVTLRGDKKRAEPLESSLVRFRHSAGTR